MSKRHLLERAGLGGIDPNLGRSRSGRRAARGKPLGMGGVRRGEHGTALGDALLRQADVHVMGRQQAEAGVVMLGVVPGEEGLAVGPRVLDRAEAVRERRPVLERLELRFRKRVVGMSAMRVLRFASAARAGSVSKPSSLWCVSRDWLRTS